MVNGSDEKYDDQDDSEYHFTDDQVSYEIDSDTAKANGASGQSPIISILSQYRRQLIGLVVFFVLIFVIYSMLTPATQVQSTDISGEGVPPPTKKALKAQAEAAAKVKAVEKAEQAAQQQTQSQAPQQPPEQVPAVTPAPAPQEVATPTATQAAQPPAQPTVPTAAPAAMPVPPTQATPQAAPPTIPQPQAMVAPTVAPTQQPLPAALPQTTPAAIPAPAATAPAQLTEEPGMMPLPASTPTGATTPGQADNGQHLAELQEQNAQLHEQVQEMSTRIVTMERNMNRLLQALGNRGAAIEYGAQAPANKATPAVPSAPMPRIAYSVQAIIPGRAWLKSDSGDTITVAEGDKLKGVGRVMKIDPYDGVVEIDTGSRIVSLSYGANGD